MYISPHLLTQQASDTVHTSHRSVFIQVVNVVPVNVIIGVEIPMTPTGSDGRSYKVDETDEQQAIYFAGLSYKNVIIVILLFVAIVVLLFATILVMYLRKRNRDQERDERKKNGGGEVTRPETVALKTQLVSFFFFISLTRN